jgi:hypothetical protein
VFSSFVVRKALRAAHNVRPRHRARRVCARLLHPPQTAPCSARHGLRYRPGERVGVRNGVRSGSPYVLHVIRKFVSALLYVGRPCSAYVSGGPRRGGGLFDCARVEAHAIMKSRGIRRSHRTKNNCAWVMYMYTHADCHGKHRLPRRLLSRTCLNTTFWYQNRKQKIETRMWLGSGQRWEMRR